MDFLFIYLKFLFTQNILRYLPAKSASLYNDQRIDDLSKYNLINKDKSIYLLNIDRPQKDASWKLIDKSELN